MRRRGVLVTSLVIGMVLAACGADGPADDGAAGPAEDEAASLAQGITSSSTLRLRFHGLEPLRGGYHYEGWALIGGQPRTTGKFNADARGRLVTLRGAPIRDGQFRTDLPLHRASAIVITIEPAGDTDEVPAATHYLGGALAGRWARLTAGDATALGDNHVGDTGRYILATPTDGMGTNEKSGIWFISLESGSPGPGLHLPMLPAGWLYEGWVVLGDRPLTTGKFRSAMGADMAAPYSGPQPGPPFPGEDYLRNAPPGPRFPIDLSGDMAVLTIEPDPDDAPAPFTLKPLQARVPAHAQDHETYRMWNRADAFPTGVAVLLR